MKTDSTMQLPQLLVDNISIGYAGRPVVEGISFHLKDGEIACLLGPSGCGKTSVLRAIAGFEPLMQGSIVLHGKTVSDAEFSLPPEKRHVGMVFQDFALFPHLTVAKNIGFGLQKLPRKQQQQRVDELLELVELTGAQTSILINFPVDSSSVLPWHGRWHHVPIFCCWTSPFPAWIPTCVSNLPEKYVIYCVVMG